MIEAENKIDNIPVDLIDTPNWIVWKYEEKTDSKGDVKLTKIPKQINGSNANTTNPNTWADFDSVVEVAEHFDGIGFVFTDSGYLGIDIDNVPEDIKEYKQHDNVDLDHNIVAEFIELTQSYAEVSPSGNGIHIYVKGQLPEGSRRKGNVEMYDSGRFFTVTGNLIGGYKGISDNEDLNVVEYLHSKYIGSKEEGRRFIPDETAGNDYTADELIEKINASNQKEKFNKLFYEGDISDYINPDSGAEDPSMADMALVGILRWWTNNDTKKIDTLFRQSSLMRDKWDSKRGNSTYGLDTIRNVISQSDGSGFKKPMMKYEMNVPNNEKKPLEKFYSYDDTGNAEKFVDLFSKDIRYSYEAKSWFVYDGKVWVEDNRGKIQQMAAEIPEVLKHQPIRVSDINDESLVNKAEKQKSDHLKYTRSYRGKDNFIKESQHRVSIANEDFDNAGNVLNLQNGYYDLDEETFKNHDRELYLTTIGNASYDREAKCPLWIQFINETFKGDKELIDYVQRAVGYSLSNMTVERQLFILYGEGNNGKSVFINVLEELLGTYAKNINPEALMASKNVDSDTPSPSLAKLQKARLVTSSESKAAMTLDEGLAKRLTGNDKITARFLNQNEITFTPEFKIWISTNHKPVIKSKDFAIWNRLVLIPFENKVTNNEVDEGLTNKLKEELSGILNWAIEGYYLYKIMGLRKSEPETIQAQRDNYQYEMDTLGQFIDERCVLDPEASVKSSDIWKSFKAWSEENNEYAGTNRKLSMELEKKFDKEKRRDGNHFVGIRLK